MNKLYRDLKYTHPSYDRLQLEKNKLLYKGGIDIIKSAALFIPQRVGESENTYKARLSNATYTNYFAAVVDNFVSSLFSKDVSIVPSTDEDVQVDEFYNEFAHDADRCGQSFAQSLKKVFRESLINGVGYIGVDFPISETLPASIQEEDSLGLSRAYTYYIDPVSVVNYSINELNEYDWLLLKKETYVQAWGGSEPLVQFEFKLWESKDSRITWTKYKSAKLYKLNEEPKDFDEFVIDSEGSTSFKQIPVIRLEMPEGLNVAQKIGAICIDHFRLRSSLFFAQERSLYAMPYFKQGAELPASGDHSYINENVHRGLDAAQVFSNRGFTVIGPEDELGFVEPKGTSYEIVDKQINDIVNEIYRVVGQMSQAIAVSGKESRSAAAKHADNKSLEMILSEYGKLVKQFGVAIYTMISEARLEDIEWQGQGLSSYEVIDKEQLISEAVSFNEMMIDVPSITFKKAYLSKIAQSFAPNVSPEIMLQIEKEISEYCDKNKDKILKMSEPLEDHADEVNQA